MATSTAALGKVYCIHSNVSVQLPDVSFSLTMLLGGDGEEEREHHPRGGSLWKGGCLCVFVCAMSHCSWDMLLRDVVYCLSVCCCDHLGDQ